MSRRKGPTVEAWALVDAKGEIYSLQTDRWWPAHALEQHARVRLVPADPDREAVVRAAVKWATHDDDDKGRLWSDVEDALKSAVEKLQRKGRKP